MISDIADAVFLIPESLNPARASCAGKRWYCFAIDLFKHYYKVNEKGKIKLAKKIQNEIDKINPEKKRDLNSISSRLAKPVVGGLTFRANNKDEIIDVSLTHSCKGRAGIAFKTILLVHK